MTEAMDPDRWQRINDVFAEAVRAEAAERAALLERLCADDKALHDEVEALIRAHEAAGSFILESAFPAVAAALESGTSVPETIGPYRILREIGQGGMGTVYLAERRDEYRQRVAIKLVRVAMASEGLLRRFRKERQILANLDHPHIARLLDGGTTTEGSPYLVMEYIEGEPITEYCDRRCLTIADRLRLFAAACTAVDYAHQHLVVHRDLKPANILITAEGSPKLLDFGIAKLLERDETTETTCLTRTGLHPMTPEYASPEQARGEPVTTATDTYSLGMVLYELLCGQRPYAITANAPSEIERAICHSACPRPSTRIPGAPPEVSEQRGTSPEKLRRLLRGDLDNVVLMAMRKEAGRRYSSVAQLAEDLRRHLGGLPVVARADTLAYRGWKFVRRNRIAVVAGAVTTVGLLTGLVVASQQAQEARAQRAIAEKRLADARQFAFSMIQQIEATYDTKTRTATQELLTEKAVGYLDALAQEAGSDLKLRRDLAAAYAHLGKAQGFPIQASLGNQAKAIESYRKAATLMESLYAADPRALADPTLDRRGDLGWTYTLYALSLAPGSAAESLAMHQKSLALSEERARADPRGGGLDVRTGISSAMELVGERLGHPYYANVGDTARALEYCQRAFALRQADDAAVVVSTDPNLARQRFDLADSYNLMAGMLWATGRLEEALRYQETSLDLWWKHMGGRADPMLRDEFALRHVRWANLLVANGQFREARQHVTQATEILESLYRADPANAAVLRDLTRAYNQVAVVLLHEGRPTDALASGAKGAKLGEDALAGGANDAEFRDRLADSYQVMGNALSKLGRSRPALERMREALGLRQSLADLDPHNARFRFLLALNHTDAAEVLLASGDPREAERNYLASVAILGPLCASDPINMLKRRALATASSGLERAKDRPADRRRLSRRAS